MENVTISQAEYDALIKKSTKWDNLEKEIGSFYFDESGDEIPEEQYDLTDIGLAAAIAFGYM